MKGKLIIILSIVITILLWIAGYGIPNITLLDIAKLTGLIGAVMISWEFILSARNFILEELFGGLDQVYKVHHFVGQYGFLLLLVHPISLAIKSFLSSSNFLIYLLPIGPIQYSMGVWAIYIFIILLFVTIFLKIEYHLWKLTHNLMGIPLMLMLIHILTISSDISKNQILRSWILIFVVSAIISFAYKRFLYPYLKGYSFKVERINTYSNAWEIQLKEVGKNRFKPNPGQFIFSEIFNRKLRKESHPFSVAGIGGNGELTIIAKNLGDYTQNLNNLNPGDSVRIFGPHGKFDRNFNTNEKEVWIAGGIGIAPFFSILEDYLRKGVTINATLYYIVKSSSDFIKIEELNRYANLISGFKFIAYDTSIMGRINASFFYADETQKYIFCASKLMTGSLIYQLKQNGVKSNKIRTELFTLY